MKGFFKNHFNHFRWSLFKFVRWQEQVGTVWRGPALGVTGRTAVVRAKLWRLYLEGIRRRNSQCSHFQRTVRTLRMSLTVFDWPQLAAGPEKKQARSTEATIQRWCSHLRRLCSFHSIGVEIEGSDRSPIVPSGPIFGPVSRYFSQTWRAIVLLS